MSVISCQSSEYDHTEREWDLYILFLCPFLQMYTRHHQRICQCFCASWSLLYESKPQAFSGWQMHCVRLLEKDKLLPGIWLKIHLEQVRKKTDLHRECFCRAFHAPALCISTSNQTAESLQTFIRNKSDPRAAWGIPLFIYFKTIHLTKAFILLDPRVFLTHGGFATAVQWSLFCAGVRRQTFYFKSE